MDFFSCPGSFLTESSITLDILDTAELWTWEFWMARSTVMFMMFWEDIPGVRGDGAEDTGPTEDEGAGCGKNGRESWPPGGGGGAFLSAICLSISELMC